MQLIGQHIYVDVPELEEYGVPTNSIKSGLQRTRKNLHSLSTYCGLPWQHITDPTDRRRVLIRLDSIPARTRTKYNLPTEQEAREQMAANTVAGQEARTHIEQLSLDARFLSAVNEGYVNWIGRYLNPHTYRDDEHPGYDQITARHLAKAASVAELAIHLTDDEYTVKQVFKPIKNLRLKYLNISSRRYFYAKIKACRDNGIFETIRPPREGNVNRKKTDERHEFLAEYLYSIGAPRLTEYEVWRRVAYKCQAEGIYVPSEGWVKKHLHQPDVQNRLQRRRYGKAVHGSLTRGYLSRKMAWFPGDAWMEDGTKLMMRFVGKDGKPRTCWIYAVIDVYSGYVVGYALDTSETRHIRLAAHRMAAQRAGYLPALIARDQHAHSKTDEIGNMEDIYERAGVLIDPAPVGQSQYKAHIERFFGTFQSTTLSQAVNYIGEGITSQRGKHARPNVDAMVEREKDGSLPTWQEFQAQVRDLVNIYNQTARRKKPAPSELFNEDLRPHAIELTPEINAQAYWPVRRVTMRRNELVLTIDHLQHKFAFRGKEAYKQNARWNTQQVLVRYDQHAPEDPIYVFDPETDKLIDMAYPKVVVNGNKALQTEADEQTLAREAAIINRMDEYLEAENERKRQAAEDLGLDTEPGELAPLLDYRVQNKQALDSQESYELDSYLRHQGVYTAEPRPVKVLKDTSAPKLRRASSGGADPYDVKGSGRVIGTLDDDDF